MAVTVWTVMVMTVMMNGDKNDKGDDKDLNDIIMHQDLASIIARSNYKRGMRRPQIFNLSLLLFSSRTCFYLRSLTQQTQRLLHFA